MLLQSQPDGPVQDQVHEASHEDGGLDVQMQSTQNNTLLLMIAADRFGEANTGGWPRKVKAFEAM
jgi:hypothetical protein